MPEGEVDAASAQVLAAVAIKLPKIWPQSIDLWFQQVESQFALRGIVNDDTKYHHVVAVLEENTARHAASVLSDPPAQGKYQALKNVLLKRCGLSELARAQKLLQLHGLGDRRPSDLLSDMQAIQGTMGQDTWLKALFLEQLPEDVKVTLSGDPTKTVEELARMADDMVRSKGALPPISATQSTKASTDAKRKYCYYHRKFRNNARRCVPPCSWVNKSLNEIDVPENH